MKRRTLFRAGVLLGLSATISSPALRPAAPGAIAGNKGFRRFPLGDLELTVVSDGQLVMRPVQPYFAPDVAPEKIRALLEERFRPTDRIDLGINLLVIKKTGRLILIDTGMGVNAGEPGETGAANGFMIRSLQTAGFAPADFTDIVITHAHPDHLGGILSKNGQPAFPHAKIHLSKIEFDFWTSASPDFSKSRIDPKMVAPIAEATRKTLRQLQSSLSFFAPGDTLCDCLKPELAAGHTPGHMLVRVFSGSNELVHIADLVHSDVLLFPYPEWGFYGDTDFSMAAATRRSVMNNLAQSRTRVLAYHLPWPGLGFVRTKDEGFEWVAETFAGPESF